MRHTWQLILGLAVSGLFLWFALRHVDIHQILRLFHSIRFGHVILYTLTLVFIQVCRTLRWQVLTQPFVRLGPRMSWRISSLGNMMMMLLPLRLGELSRPYLLKKETGDHFTSSVAAVAVEKIIDGLLVSILFFCTTWFLQPPYHVSQPLRLSALLALSIFGAASVLIGLTWFTQNQIPQLIRQRGAPILGSSTSERIANTLESFVIGLRSLPDLQAILTVVLWTLLYWASNALGLYCLMLAFGWQLPLVAAFTLVSVLVIGIMVPAGPGLLGTYQASIIIGLAIFGVSKTDAIAYSMLAYPINLAVVVGFGLPYLFGTPNVPTAVLDRSVPNKRDSLPENQSRSEIY